MKKEKNEKEKKKKDRLNNKFGGRRRENVKKRLNMNSSTRPVR